MSKLERLLAIIMLLLERKTLSAAMLAEQFSVSTRTIYRDIDILTLAGIPITTTRGSQGGISILARYKVDKQIFTESDIMALLRGIDSITPTVARSQVAATLSKLKNLIPETQRQTLELRASQISIDLTNWIGNSMLQPHLESIKTALEQHQELQVEYRDSNLKQSQRRIEPYQLIFKEGRWYLYAYCHKRADFRTFKLSRIMTLQMLDSIFIPRVLPDHSLRCRSWQTPAEFVPVTLQVSAALHETMTELWGEASITPCDNGDFRVCIPFLLDEQGIRMLLGFGAECECLEPEWVRERMIQEIEKLRKVYL